jgi:lipopolysaccharide transport system ATP-binding protein
MSFHPELTGRENAVLFGTIIGLNPAAITSQMDAITAFAELEGHLDTPVKRYSDGMKARLSFAIAIRLPADIYIFDEVLAVVDDAFRDRCLAQIDDLRHKGKLILFVSHDMRQVRSLCTHAVWLDHGRVRKAGTIESVLPEYERERAAHSAQLRAADISLNPPEVPAAVGGR